MNTGLATVLEKERRKLHPSQIQDSRESINYRSCIGKANKRTNPKPCSVCVLVLVRQKSSRHLNPC